MNGREKIYHGLCLANSRFIGKVVGMLKKRKGGQGFEQYLPSLLKRSKAIVVLLELAEREVGEAFLTEEKAALCREFDGFFFLFKKGDIAELKEEGETLILHLSEIERKVEQKFGIKNELHHVTSLDVLGQELVQK